MTAKKPADEEAVPNPRLEAAKERLRNHGWHLGDGEGLQDCPFDRALLRVLENEQPSPEGGGRAASELEAYRIQWAEDCDLILAALEEK